MIAGIQSNCVRHCTLMSQNASVSFLFRLSSRKTSVWLSSLSGSAFNLFSSASSSLDGFIVGAFQFLLETLDVFLDKVAAILVIKFGGDLIDYPCVDLPAFVVLF